MLKSRNGLTFYRRNYINKCRTSIQVYLSKLSPHKTYHYPKNDIYYVLTASVNRFHLIRIILSIVITSFDVPPNVENAMPFIDRNRKTMLWPIPAGLSVVCPRKGIFTYLSTSRSFNNTPPPKYQSNRSGGGDWATINKLCHTVRGSQSQSENGASNESNKSRQWKTVRCFIFGQTLPLFGYVSNVPSFRGHQ